MSNGLPLLTRNFDKEHTVAVINITVHLYLDAVVYYTPHKAPLHKSSYILFIPRIYSDAGYIDLNTFENPWVATKFNIYIQRYL